MNAVYDTRYQKDSVGLVRAARAVRTASDGRCVACGGDLGAWSGDLPGFGWHCWPCIDRMADPLRANPIYAVPAGWEADEMAECARCRECGGEGAVEEFDGYGVYGSQVYLRECDDCGGTGRAS